ncbi:MAG TPA: hypothetical protein DDY68_02905 [Porphyromonadaceae bacterium]|nr:hypothetical protein [Porphyromonadaceae bacterium]
MLLRRYQILLHSQSFGTFSIPSIFWKIVVNVHCENRSYSIFPEIIFSMNGDHIVFRNRI